MATKKTEKVITIKVVSGPEKEYRANSARDLYWSRIKTFDGKTLEAFKADVVKSVPSVPTTGKMTGKPEPVRGWVSYFVNQGFVQLTSK